MIAIPSNDPISPSPHLTGGAVDIVLRYKQTTKLYVPDCNIQLREDSVELNQVNYPDYYETILSPNPVQQKIRKNRRLFFSIMNGRLFGIENELACNPTEWWHWSYGDQLWAYVKSQETAYYSIAD